MARIALPAIAFVALCNAAFAADPDTHATAEQCAALAKQYDIASKDKVNPDKLKKSQTQRAHGADLCAQGKLDSGVKALKSALKDIGLKPAS
jgi:hypothetical protein